VKEKKLGVTVYGSISLDKCYKMDPQQHWRGLWRDQFEGSRFCPEPAANCQYNTPGDVIWLDAERVSRKEPDGALYAVEFIGRRTAVKGHYGHMGGSDYELIVDRFISLDQIAPSLPRETEAQIEAEMQRCRRMKQCSSWNR
jgi:hypothetical protein